MKFKLATFFGQLVEIWNNSAKINGLANLKTISAVYELFFSIFWGYVKFLRACRFQQIGQITAISMEMQEFLDTFRSSH